MRPDQMSRERTRSTFFIVARSEAEKSRTSPYRSGTAASANGSPARVTTPRAGASDRAARSATGSAATSREKPVRRESATTRSVGEPPRSPG